MCGVYIRTKNGRKKRRMLLIEDLRLHETANILKDINLGSYEVYENKPKTCGSCNSKYLYGVEIFGADKAPLLWECGKCHKIFLKFNVDLTLNNFAKSSALWTNPEDWGYQDPEEFN